MVDAARDRGGQTANRLSKFVDLPDGMTYERAVALADLQLQAIQESAVEDLVDALERALASAASVPVKPCAEDTAVLYELCNGMSGVAGMLNQAALGRAANYLCQLVDMLHENGEWDAEAFALHVSTLRMLHPGQKVEPALAETVLGGLGRIVDKVRHRLETSSKMS